MAYINGREVLFSPTVNITENAGTQIEGKDITLEISASDSGVVNVYNAIGIIINLSERYMLSELCLVTDFNNTIPLKNVASLQFFRDNAAYPESDGFTCNITFDMLVPSIVLTNDGDKSGIIDIKNSVGVYGDNAYAMIIGGA